MSDRGATFLIDGLNIYDSEADILALRKRSAFCPKDRFPAESIYDNIAFDRKFTE